MSLSYTTMTIGTNSGHMSGGKVDKVIRKSQRIGVMVNLV